MKQIVRKMLFVDLIKGLGVTFRNQSPKQLITEQYPLQRPQIAERFRGAPRLGVNPDTNESLCIACDLCAVACPEHLIVVGSERNPVTRRKELTEFTYDLSRCMFCGLCEDACPTDALELTQDFEMAQYSREGLIWNRETLEKGPEPQALQALEQTSASRGKARHANRAVSIARRRIHSYSKIRMAAAITVVHSPRLSPTAVWVIFMVRTILLDSR